MNRNYEDINYTEPEDEYYFQGASRRRECNVTSCRECNPAWTPRRKKVSTPDRQTTTTSKTHKAIAKFCKWESDCDWCPNVIAWTSQADQQQCKETHLREDDRMDVCEAREKHSPQLKDPSVSVKGRIEVEYDSLHPAVRVSGPGHEKNKNEPPETPTASRSHPKLDSSEHDLSNGRYEVNVNTKTNSSIPNRKTWGNQIAPPHLSWEELSELARECPNELEIAKISHLLSSLNLNGVMAGTR